MALKLTNKNRKSKMRKLEQPVLRLEPSDIEEIQDDVYKSIDWVKRNLNDDIVISEVVELSIFEKVKKFFTM